VYAEKNQNNIADESYESALSLDPDNLEIMRDYYNHLRTTQRLIRCSTGLTLHCCTQSRTALKNTGFWQIYYRDQGENYKVLYAFIKLTNYAIGARSHAADG
jgi:hypothetical protein